MIAQALGAGMVLVGVTGLSAVSTIIANALMRGSKNATVRAVSGWLITYSEGGVSVNNPASQQIIQPSKWWKCCLPWPGRRKWAETVLAKAALLGAIIEYQAVSAWDWDEAYVIVVDADTIIASSNKVATALAYLKHKGIEL